MTLARYLSNLVVVAPAFKSVRISTRPSECRLSYRQSGTLRTMALMEVMKQNWVSLMALLYHRVRTPQAWWWPRKMRLTTTSITTLSLTESVIHASGTSDSRAHRSITVLTLWWGMLTIWKSWSGAAQQRWASNTSVMSAWSWAQGESHSLAPALTSMSSVSTWQTLTISLTLSRLILGSNAWSRLRLWSRGIQTWLHRVVALSWAPRTSLTWSTITPGLKSRSKGRWEESRSSTRSPTVSTHLATCIAIRSKM